MNWIWSILQFVLGFFEVFLSYRLCDQLIVGRKLFSVYKIYTYICISFVAALLAINRSIIFFSNSLFLLNIIFIWLSIVVLHREKLFETLLIIINYFVIISLFDYLFFLLILFFYRDDLREFIYQGVNGQRIIVFSMTRMLTFLLLCKFILKDKVRQLEHGKYILLLTGILGCICLRRFQMAIVAFQADRRFWDSIFLTAFLIALGAVFAIYNRNVLERNQKQLITMKNDMLESNYNNLIQLHNKNRILYHDYKNHLYILRRYMEEQQYGKAVDYLDGILGDVQKRNDVIWQNEDIVQLVLNLKSFEAEQKGIDFKIDIDDISWMAYEEKDLGTIFFNLLDNAIEACERMENMDTWIKVSVKLLNEITVIKIENSVTGMEGIEQGRYISQKENKIIHGIGMKSVRQAVEKYNGIVKWGHGQDRFIVNITLFGK